MKSEKPYVRYPPDPPSSRGAKLLAMIAVVLLVSILWRLLA
jgi:hypothetical protein